MTAACPPRECPVCGSLSHRLFFHQDFATVDHTTPVTGYDVVVCKRCGCGYADGIPDQAAFDRYYHEVHIPLAKKMKGLKGWTIGKCESATPGEAKARS